MEETRIAVGGRSDDRSVGSADWPCGELPLSTGGKSCGGSENARTSGGQMRQVIIMTMLASGAMTALPSLPTQAQYAVCIPARGCAPATQASYNACYQLALRRGWRDSDNVERDLGGRALDY